MAKCSLCMKTKGKRKCQAFGAAVCSSCCGTFRTEERCHACAHFRLPQETRRYDTVPYFETHEMAAKEELQKCSETIERAICDFDGSHQPITRDALYLSLMERLMDRHHFGDERVSFSSDLEEEGFGFVEGAIQLELQGLPSDALTRIIGAVYRSIRRRTRGHREYLDFISQFMGVRVAGVSGRGARGV